MKVYTTQYHVGKAKYVVKFHDGEKTHEDGSPFFDIAIFKSLVKRKAFLKKLSVEGYVER